MKRILITGSAGFIGSSLFNALIAKYDVAGFDIVRSETTSKICDVGNDEALSADLLEFRPEVIIHTAAIKGLKACEARKISSWKNNVDSTRAIVRYAYEKNAKIIYISSDVVFDGHDGNYLESDLPNPINWYGTTKFYSELLVRQLTNFAICRTALVFGNLPEFCIPVLKQEVQNSVLENQTLFPHYVLAMLHRGHSVYMPSDVISSPTHIEILVKAVEKIVDGDIRGIFHTCGPDAISRFALAQKIASQYGFDEKQIIEDNTKVFRMRPKNLSMNVDLTYKIFGLHLEDWRIDRAIKKIIPCII
jgi:dTDP-4-dehydrorhamnose reductase